MKGNYSQRPGQVCESIVSVDASIIFALLIIHCEKRYRTTAHNGRNITHCQHRCKSDRNLLSPVTDRFYPFQVDYEAELTEIKEFLQHYVKPARGQAHLDLPRDDDAQAEEDVESEDDDLEDGLGGMDMDDDEEARARRPKAKYMKIFVSCGVLVSRVDLTHHRAIRPK